MENLGPVQGVDVNLRIRRQVGTPDRVMAMSGRAGMVGMIPEDGPMGRAYIYVAGDFQSDAVQLYANVMAHAAGAGLLASALTTALLGDRHGPRVHQAVRNALKAVAHIQNMQEGGDTDGT